MRFHSRFSAASLGLALLVAWHGLRAAESGLEERAGRSTDNIFLSSR